MRTMTLRTLLAALLVSCAAVSAQPPQPAGPPDPAADLVKQGQQKMREGKADEALAIYRKAVESFPNSFQANSQLGVALDLNGEYAEARTHLAKAIAMAASPQQKTQAQRSMAMSYAFERDCGNAAKFETPLYEMYLAAKNFYNAGEIANELARVCLESDDIDTAQRWYRTGHEAGLKEPGIKPERRDLWEFRNEHALARIAARRGNKAEAQTHVAAAKAILDKGTNPEQAPFFPYLVGYVAFYTGDFKTAVAELQKGNQNDPFILALIAQAYEKLGDDAQAKEYYRKVLAVNVHNPTGAYARPLAKKKLGQG